MSDVKVYNLVVRLLENTETNKLKWEATAWGNKFLTVSGAYSISVSSEAGEYYVSIADKFDDVLEVVSDSDLYNIDRSASEVMRSLFVMARRNALGTEKIIDDILGSLE